MIKVMIERMVAEEMESTYGVLLNETLGYVSQARGFLSGTSYVDANNDHRRVTITEWDNIDSWLNWFNSDKRKEMNSQIRMLLDQDERITVLKYKPLK